VARLKDKSTFPSTAKGKAFAERVKKTRAAQWVSSGGAAREREKLSKAAIAREATDPEFFALRERWRRDGLVDGRINQRDRERCHRRRASFMGARYSGVTQEEWKAIRLRFTDANGIGLCCYCARPCKQTIDHLVPLSRGGPHAPENVLPACHSCNASKRDRLLGEWPKARSLLPDSLFAELMARSDIVQRNAAGPVAIPPGGCGLRAPPRLDLKIDFLHRC
jgi:5-methylcytosine-specific restriction endonuclease McrA